MAANADDPQHAPHRGTGPAASECMPLPDPTKLTTEQLRRELATLREIIETRLDGMDRATEVARSQAAVSRAQIEQIRDRQREETVTQSGSSASCWRRGSTGWTGPPRWSAPGSR